MSELQQAGQLFRFAAFEVDTRAGELKKHGLRIRLQEQPFQVLAILLQRPGEVVTREELRQRLWSEDTFVDFDHSLNTAINKLREALSDSPDSPRYIETLPRRGYRFIAPVEQVPAAPVPANVEKPSESPAVPAPAQRRWRVVPVSEEPAAAPVEKQPEKERKPEKEEKPKKEEKLPARMPAPRRRPWKGIVIAVLALAIVLTNWDWITDWLGGPDKIESIAVLPLENLSGNPEEDYFADGMTDAVITNLARIKSLRVISRTSVMQYKKARKPLPDIAKELDVDGIVEGTVMRSGSRVRITVQLLNGRTDRHLWAQEYERDLTDVVALQREVARAIVDEIRIQLTPEEQQTLSAGREPSPEAYDALIRGRFHFEKRTEEGLRLANSYFRQAIEKDPGYAAAYAGLADYFNTLAFYSVSPPGQGFPRAKEMADKAIELDPTLAEPHAALGMVYGEHEWNWDAAEKEFHRAFQLNPNYAPGHHWYAEQLICLGRAEEAYAEVQKSAALAPLSLVSNSQVALFHYYARQYDRVIEIANRMLELDADFPLGHMWLGMAYQQKGMNGQAIEVLRKAAELPQALPLFHALLGNAYGRAGKRQEALGVARKLEQLSRTRYVSPAYIALVYAGLGDRTQFFVWLEKSYQERSPLIIRMRVEPMLDPFRADPRFQQILRRVGFPPEPAAPAAKKSHRLGFPPEPAPEAKKSP
jgi:TolB-like protein/DNA-binding winged helix-turn-helix (wHTH) protein/tetratricopeptide (TPR) repeat protein